MSVTGEYTRCCERNIFMTNHCCDEMKDNIYYLDRSDRLKNKTDGNKVIYYASWYREYGIPVKDGRGIASSYIVIKYCPWCGKLLPSSKREEWFCELEKLGYESPLEQEIPLIFSSSAWYEAEEKKEEKYSHDKRRN